jgi:hypothetical protein
MGKNKRLLDVFWHDGTHLTDAAMFLSGRVLKHHKSYGAKLAKAAGNAWLEGELLQPESGAGQRRDAIPFVMEVGAGRDYVVFANMIADAVSCVREPGRRPISSAADGLAVIEYLHSVKAWR